MLRAYMEPLSLVCARNEQCNDAIVGQFAKGLREDGRGKSLRVSRWRLRRQWRVFVWHVVSVPPPRSKHARLLDQPKQGMKQRVGGYRLARCLQARNRMAVLISRWKGICQQCGPALHGDGRRKACPGFKGLAWPKQCEAKRRQRSPGCESAFI